MPRHITNNNTCKIRKRVISSSSSSSSLVKSYRFKRAIITNNKTNFTSNTHQLVPTTKFIMAGSKSPIQKLVNFGENGVKYGKNSSNGGYYKGSKDGFTARKLAASLWEINGFHSPNNKSYDKYDKVFDHGELDHFPRSPFSEKSDGSKVRSHRRSSASSSQKNQITEHIAEGVDSVGKASSIEVASHTTGDINNSSIKTHLKDVKSSLVTSKELVKVLFRILSNEEQQSSKLTLVSALRVELERARVNVDQLVREYRSNSTQIDTLLKQFVEEKASWKSKEKVRIREAVSSISKELEMERKLRRQAERLNKKLGTELAETRAYFSRSVKEIDDERRAREILEKTCDELAKGLGQERAEVEKVKQEAEKERQMLQLADILREERVQMKLAEARYEFEEKSSALERLKSELETYMNDNDCKDNDGDGFELGSVQIDEKEASEGEVDDEEDSCESELHSIELNMDNKNKSYKWSFTCEGSNQSEVFNGRKSLSEKIQWENICLQKRTSDSIECDFITNNKQPNTNDNANGGENSNGDYEDDIRRYQMIKGDRLSSCQESVSSAMSTGRSSSRLREACSAILQDLAFKRDKIQGQCGGNKR